MEVELGSGQRDCDMGWKRLSSERSLLLEEWARPAAAGVGGLRLTRGLGFLTFALRCGPFVGCWLSSVGESPRTKSVDGN